MREIVYTVKEGAKLECTFGTEESELKVPADRGTKTQDGNAATIMDYIPYVNIFPFCRCKREVPGLFKEDFDDAVIECTPEIVMPWIKGREDYKLQEELALLNICIVPCIYGGIIKIKDTGQIMNK